MNRRLITNRGPLNMDYMNRIEQTIYRALGEYPRTMAVRVDLRSPVQGDTDMPRCFATVDSGAISRFFESLTAQLDADTARKAKSRIRVYPCTLRYVWVKEKNQEFKDHYHVLLLLNKDAYAHLGRFSSTRTNLVNKIRQAWASALRINAEVSAPLVYIPENPIYYLDRNAPDEVFIKKLNKLVYRVSYLAKKETKQYGDGFRSFGCSRR
jgi:hypothetical protein